MNERMRKLAAAIPIIGGAEHALLSRSDGVYRPLNWRATAAMTITTWITLMKTWDGIVDVEHVPKENLLWAGLEEAEAFNLVGKNWILLVAVKEGGK